MVKNSTEKRAPLIPYTGIYLNARAHNQRIVIILREILRQLAPDTGITLFTLIHDPINGKPDIIVLYQARNNACA